MQKFIGFLLLITLLVSSATYSQIIFQKGYFIDNDDRKVDCLIKNIDWANNPTSFEYKTSDDDESQKTTIENVKEFGVNNVSKYVRFTGNIDRSSEDIINMSNAREPQFNREQLFLKVLIEGRASLYAYTDGNLQRFFYKVDSLETEQLVYKSYKVDQSVVSKNIMFRQQLINTLGCDESLRKRIPNVNYSQRDLTKLFEQYNSCVHAESNVYTTKEKRDIFNLWIRPRVTSSSFSARRQSINTLNFQFENKVAFSVGAEAELILPFNKNKWAIIVEPTYQSYASSIPAEPIKVDYEAIELPIGVRHYFFISNNSKVSLSAAFQVNFTNSSTFIHKTNVALDVSRSTNLAFEAGYTFKNRFCLAYRYQTKREIIGGYRAWTSDFETMAFVFGYSIF